MKKEIYEMNKYLKIKESIYKLEEILLQLEDLAFDFSQEEEEVVDE